MEKEYLAKINLLIDEVDEGKFHIKSEVEGELRYILEGVSDIVADALGDLEPLNAALLLKSFMEGVSERTAAYYIERKMKEEDSCKK